MKNDSIQHPIAPRRLAGILLGLACCLPCLMSCSSGIDHPSITVTPREGVVGEVLEFEFTLTVPKQGMDGRGGFQVELAIGGTRGFGRKIADILFDPPTDDNTSVATSSSTGTVELGREKDGTLPRRYLVAWVKEGRLQGGDTMTLTYRTALRRIAGTLSWKYRTRLSDNSRWTQAQESELASLKINPGLPAFYRLISPANLQTGETFDLRIVGYDENGNLARAAPLDLRLQATDDDIHQLPGEFKIQDTGPGNLASYVVSNLSYVTPGFQMIRGKIDSTPVYSHSSWVHDRENTNETAPLSRLFGDTQFHTSTGVQSSWRDASGDHYGNYTYAEQAYAYARDAARLDFASLSEHDLGMSQAAWRDVKDITERYNDPPVFTTLFAWEYTTDPTQHAHQVILSPSSDLPFLDQGKAPTPEALWVALDRMTVPVLSIPHPMYSERTRKAPNPIFDRDKRNERYQKIGEIYSHHSQDTNQWKGPVDDAPQIHEEGIDRKCSFQYAWASGMKIGVIGSSDNHLQTPGLPSFAAGIRHGAGLAVVLAEENSREAIFDALEHRRCYATTGPRIYLDLTLDGHLMGEELEITRGETVTISLAVGGSDELEEVSILKLENKVFKPLLQVDPDGPSFQETIQDTPSSDTLYYLRMRQEKRTLDGNTVPGAAAFSSPIWVSVTEKD